MCMKNYNAEKIIFDKFTAFFNIAIFDHCLYTVMVGSAYFVKSILLQGLSVFLFNTLQTCSSHIEDVHEEF